MIHSNPTQPANPANSSDSQYGADELKGAVHFVLNHLQRESDYLDTVIQCSLRMKELLQKRQPVSMNDPGSEQGAHIETPAADLPEDHPDGEAQTAIPAGSAQPAGQHTDPLNGGLPTTGQPAEQLAPHEQLTALRGDLARQFVPILEGRQQMNSAIRVFQPLIDDPPTVTSLAVKLEDPARSQLKQLRADIKHKLNEIRAITMGNQAVLIYTMDFYHRLLNGLSPDAPAAKAYNADGKLTNQVGSGLLKKDC